METRDNANTGNDLEIRFTAAAEDDALAVRADADKPNRLVGYAAVFNSLSADLGGFKERVVPGAFKNAVTSNVDIRALVDHDSTKLLGRTSNGTLRVSEDAVGLRVEIDLPDTSYAADVKSLVARKDIRGMSFGFRVPEGGQRFTKEGGHTVRELTNIDLREVTVTSIPAYADTSIYVRVDPGAVTAAAATAPARKFPRLEMAKRKLAIHSIG
jgi:HK97 family phage prohead protease